MSQATAEPPRQQLWEEERSQLQEENAEQGRKIEELTTQVKRLEAENALLRCLLETHKIPFPSLPDAHPAPETAPVNAPPPNGSPSEKSPGDVAALSATAPEAPVSQASEESQIQPAEVQQDVSAPSIETTEPSKLQEETTMERPNTEATAERPMTKAATERPKMEVTAERPKTEVTTERPKTEVPGEDEADLAPKEAAMAIIGAFHDTAKPPSTTTSRSSSSKSVSSAEASSQRASVSSTSSEPRADAPRVQLQLTYNNSLEKLSAVVMKALDLAKLGVLDFSKIIFKADLVPGRLVSAKSATTVYSNSLPLGITLTLAVRQTSFKWKKLQLSVLSGDGGGETCLGKAQINLLNLYNNTSAEGLEIWVPFSPDGEDSVFVTNPSRQSVSSLSSPAESPAKTAQVGGPASMIRRHTLAGTEMSSSISKAKELLTSSTLTSSVTSQSPRRTSHSSSVASPTAVHSERHQQHQRMSAAVMQAARDEARRSSSSRSGSGSSTSNDTTTSRPLAEPTPTKTPAAKEKVVESDPPAADGIKAKEAAAAALAGVDIPDVRSLNRSRAGDKAVPIGQAPPSPQKDAESFSSTLSESSSDTPPKTVSVSGPEKRPSLSSVGRTASLETIPLDKRRSSSSSTSEELKKAIAQNRAAKEVLAALDKDNAEAKESAEKPADDDKEEVEEESQFVRRASFRLKALRDSQRKKPDRLSFKQKQAFFGTASVDIPDAASKK